MSVDYTMNNLGNTVIRKKGMEKLFTNVDNLAMHISRLLEVIYHTVKNFGGEKTLANLANHNNSPTFFRQFTCFVT